MPAVTLLTGSHLCHNPRVFKEAAALADAGLEVLVLGAWFDEELKQRDRDLLRTQPFAFRAVLDATGSSAAARAARLAHRLHARAGRLARSYLGLELASQLGYAVGALQRAARRIPADLFIAHSEAGLAAAAELARAGRRIGVDMEDWFSEDLLPAARIGRPLRKLRAFERLVLRSAAHRTCPSRAMSEALAAEYDCPPPLVVYNAFPLAEREALTGQRLDRRDLSVPSLHWYSQTLGPGRGLEDLLQALPRVTRPLQVHLRGRPAPGFGAWLRGRLPAEWSARVFVHELVSNHELLQRIAEHDIGFGGEMTFCRSRDLTVTNKMLHYLCGGLAVLASDTAGQKEVARLAPGAVSLYPGGDGAALAAAIDALLERPERLRAAKAAALRAAEQTFSWERQAPALVASVEAAVRSPRSPAG